nr:hypothetical protein [Paramuribaculum sp.]
VLNFIDFQPELIVSNPPFFSDSLLCENNERTLARHEGSLNFNSLIAFGSTSLVSYGKLAFISPAEKEQDIEFCAVMKRMYIHLKTYVRTVPTKNPKRILWLLGKEPVQPITRTLCIKDTSGNYSQEYIQLTKDFYLHL